MSTRGYHIAPSSPHGLGLFSLDNITVSYSGLIELMEYVTPCYNYGDWMWLVQYMSCMWGCGLSANYIQLRDKDKNKGASIYTDGKPKASGNIGGFINSTQHKTTNKKTNCIFKAH